MVCVKCHNFLCSDMLAVQTPRLIDDASYRELVGELYKTTRAAGEPEGEQLKQACHASPGAVGNEVHVATHYLANKYVRVEQWVY